MEYRKLGSSDLQVSRVCLGTMTWGKQNIQQDANEQIDYALDCGINFMDTAEMYAVPPSAETYGKTEIIIGNWLKDNPSKRSEIVLMTKIAGPGVAYIRKGKGYTAEDIMPAVDASLKRLQTDYIDVYQLHWPNRYSPHFGRHWFGKVNYARNNAEREIANMVGVLQALDECIKVGKIRYCGLSDETAWGVDKYLELAKTHNLPKMVSIQNEFSLIHSKDWPYLIESCVMNDVAYLPWSPLGGGVLSGKYAGGKMPSNTRWSFSNRHGNFRNTANVHNAVDEYVAVAKKHGITPSQLSLIWCNQFDWVTSTIIGATKMSQLKDNIEAFEITLSAEALAEIDAVKRQYPIPF